MLNKAQSQLEGKHPADLEVCKFSSLTGMFKNNLTESW